MKKAILTLSVLVAAAGAAQADHYQGYLPAKEGNRWTYYRANPVAKFAPWTVRVDDSYNGMFHVDAFPGLGDDVWMAWSGNTLYVWSWEQSKWVAFLRFGAATGTTYTVTLDGGLWTNAKVTLKSKILKLDNPHLNLTHTYVVHFTFQHPNLADAGVTEMMFAKNYGLVYWGETSFVGETTGWLGAGAIGGKKFGPMTYELLASGPASQYPMTGTNQVKLFNSKSSWETFWAQHDPNTPAPQVDFSKHTVVAILAGQRNTGGFTVQLSSAFWNYPYSGARLFVTEITPAGPVIQMLTSPFQFVVLDAKVYGASYEWNVIYNK